MPNKKGGKKFKKGKKNTSQFQKKLIIKNEDEDVSDQEYAKVLKVSGSGRFRLLCFDGKERMGTVCGQMRKRVWVNLNDVVLVSLWTGIQDDKCTIIHKYDMDEAYKLKDMGQFPVGITLEENEDEKESSLEEQKKLIDDLVQKVNVEVSDTKLTNSYEIILINDCSTDGSWEKIKFLQNDLEYITKPDLKKIFTDQEIVFHLAAIHGGRGFITTHPADVSSNFSIDHHVFDGCNETNVKNIIFASTACVYPTELQKNIGSDYKLKESDSDPLKLDGFLSADIEYGWGKLMSEMQLHAFKKQYGLKGCPVRLF